MSETAEQTLKDRVTNLREMRKQEAELEGLLGKVKDNLKSIETQIADQMLNQGTTKSTVVDDHGIDYEVDATYKNKFNVVGGKGDSEQRQALLKKLKEWGYEDDVEVYYNINGNRLNGILNELGPVQIDQLKDDKLITVYSKPEVKIK